MPLGPGTRLGSYEILSSLGAGGMGEVYRARDTRLRRDVAVKILPAAVAGQPDRVDRLEREAQLLASVNHPGIAAIYGIEDSGHGLALIMELVEGRTLKTVLDTRPLAVDDAVALARQIAVALEVAHAKGVIHRDLKPANVMCGSDGVVKLLDFGLAKVLAPASAGQTNDPSESPTISLQTQPGIVLGTAAYMAPEQARGKEVDQRADIWAFGVVLFEMLTGRRAFDGRDATEMIAHVVTKEPDWDALPPSTPPALRRLLRRCLQKDPSNRLNHIGDARLELDDARDRAKDDPRSPAAPSQHRFPFIAITLTAALVGVAAFLIGRSLTPQAGYSGDWIGERLGGSTVAMAPVASPDGKTLAFQAIVDGLTQIAVMQPHSGIWTVLTKERSRGLVDRHSWSRDGSRIFFSRYLDVPNGIYSVPVFGGEERQILENAMSPVGLPDGSLLFVRINADRMGQLHRYWPDTARVEALPAIMASFVRLPTPAHRAFPDGREVVYVGRPAGTPATDSDHLWVLDLASGRSRRIAPDVTLTFTSFTFPLAVSADGQSVLFTIPTGNTHPILSVNRDGSPGVSTVLPLTARPVAMDVAADGTLFIDQLDQPAEVFQFDPASRQLERTPMPAALTLEGGSAVPLTDGRLVLATRTLGRERLVLMSAGRDPVPFIETDEDTTGPMAALGTDAVVFLVGKAPDGQMAIASTADGRILTRLPRPDKAQVIVSVAGSPDGKTVFYTSGGRVWMIERNGGSPRPFGAGEAVAIAPDGKALVVMLAEAGGTRLVRRKLQAGAEPIDDVIPLGAVRLSPWPIAPNAVAPDGRLALRITTPDSWFWPAVVFDPRNGRVDLLPDAARADMLMPGWDARQRVVTIATLTRSSLWRFRPTVK